MPSSRSPSNSRSRRLSGSPARPFRIIVKIRSHSFLTSSGHSCVSKPRPLRSLHLLIKPKFQLVPPRVRSPRRVEKHRQHPVQQDPREIQRLQGPYPQVATSEFLTPKHPPHPPRQVDLDLRLLLPRHPRTPASQRPTDHRCRPQRVPSQSDVDRKPGQPASHRGRHDQLLLVQSAESPHVFTEQIHIPERPPGPARLAGRKRVVLEDFDDSPMRPILDLPKRRFKFLDQLRRALPLFSATQSHRRGLAVLQRIEQQLRHLLRAIIPAPGPVTLVQFPPLAPTPRAISRRFPSAP